MDILQLAQEHLLLSIGVILSVGLIQGAVLGRGIRQRFPALKTHARVASAILLVLFVINAIANTLKFANPEKTSLSGFAIPDSLEGAADFMINVLGLNTGFGAVLALFISICLILMFRSARLPNIARYFVFTLSVITFLVAVIGRFTDYVPAFFEVIMYAGYQSGITIGIFVITSRRVDPLNLE